MSRDPFDDLQPLYVPAAARAPTSPPAPKRATVDWDVPKLLRALPAVINDAEDQWAIDFARSVLRQSKRPGWKPSPKQEFIMRQLVGEAVRYPSDDRQGDLFAGFCSHPMEVVET